MSRAPHGWAGLAQVAAPELLASQAVRRRIRARWERRRAETDGVTVAASRWIVIGRYTYAHPEGMVALSGHEVDNLRGGREYLAYIERVKS